MDGLAKMEQSQVQILAFSEKMENPPMMKRLNEEFTEEMVLSMMKRSETMVMKLMEMDAVLFEK